MKTLNAVAVAVVSVLLGGACSLKMEARLLDPINRPASSGTESANVARARQLLKAEVPADTVASILVDQGLTPDEAKRTVALALTK